MLTAGHLMVTVFPMPDKNRLIEMQQLMLRYPTGKVALSGISLVIAKGSFIYLTGESGAGKSSLLRMFYGGLRPTSGQLSASSGIRDTIARVPGSRAERRL